MSMQLRPFEFKDRSGLVMESDGFPSVWVDEAEVEIDEQWIRTEDKAAVVAWLRAAADMIEANG